mgnify:CR=1 FL=1
MLNKNFKALIYSFILFSTFIQVAPLFALPPVCEEIQVDRRRIWCKSNYDVAGMNENFTTLQQRGYTPKKALGVLGELYARKTIEENTKYISIITLFKKMGCHVENDIRDGADRGVDDIFVVPTIDGRINQNFNPIFHEAKFNGNCQLKLAKTKTICQQLSMQWLNYHIQGTQQRVIGGASLCFDNKNEVIIKSCATCKSTFLDDMNWIFDMLNEHRFYRTASVLCSDGQLNVYNVISKE